MLVIMVWNDVGDDYLLLFGIEFLVVFVLYQYYCKQQNCEMLFELFEDRMSVCWSSYVVLVLFYC